jgi:hypothetical protein
MPLAVYSRVGSVLQEAGLRLEDLRDHIAVRYGLAVDNQVLAALARNGRVQRPDIEILEAVALTLRRATRGIRTLALFICQAAKSSSIR